MKNRKKKLCYFSVIEQVVWNYKEIFTGNGDAWYINLGNDNLLSNQL